MPTSAETLGEQRLSIRGYAKHRGLGSENAVRKAIAAGRIRKDKDGLIDAIQADRDWEKNTDPAFPSRKAAPMQDKAANSKEPRANGDQPIGGQQIGLAHHIMRRHGHEPSNEEFTYVDARTAAELQKMEERQIDMDVKRGRLIDKKKALGRIFDAARKERDAWQQWVPRIAAEFAAELRAAGATIDTQTLETSLDARVRKHLAELAEFKPEL